MKLLTYNINNSLFILVNNIIIKKNDNIYKIYLDNSLKHIYNYNNFINFIKNNYADYYDKINKILVNKTQGGSSIVDTPLPGNSTEAPSTDTFSETENASQLKKILKDEDYLEIYKIVLIVNKILPDDIDVDYYINLMFDKIKSDNSKLNFTKEYLIRRLNKDIDIDENKVRTLGTVCNTNTEIIDELFNKKSIIQEFYDKVYKLEKLKVSIKNDEDNKENIAKLEQDITSMLDLFIDNKVPLNGNMNKTESLFDLNNLSITDAPTIFHKILNIKYSKCVNKDLKNPKENLQLLVKYRDLKKIPKNFMEDYIYKKDIKIENADFLFSGVKSVESGLIIKSVVENMYIKTKELKLNLTNLFANYFIEIFKNKIKETLKHFSFDKSYKTDNLETVINEIISYNESLSKIMSESNIMISYSDLMIYEDIVEKYNVSLSKLDADGGIGDAVIMEFNSSNYSEGQVRLKMELLNKLILFTIKITYFELYKEHNTVNLISQLLINVLFNQIDEFTKNKNTLLGKNQILTELNNTIQIKQKTYTPLISTDTIENEGINISILDIIGRQKIARLNIRQKDDTSFISNIRPIPAADIQTLEDLEKKLFDENLIEGTKEEFINNIMFFFKSEDKNNYKFSIDENKNSLFKIFSQKILTKIRDYYKTKLENEFNELNNKHKLQLEQLGLNVDQDEIDNDEELSDKLENEVIKLNDYKFKVFTEIQDELNQISQAITGQNAELFSHIIKKYVIQNKKMPIDFSAEYHKTLLKYEEDLKRLNSMFKKATQVSEIEQTIPSAPPLEVINSLETTEIPPPTAPTAPTALPKPEEATAPQEPIAPLEPTAPTAPTEATPETTTEATPEATPLPTASPESTPLPTTTPESSPPKTSDSSSESSVQSLKNKTLDALGNDVSKKLKDAASNALGNDVSKKLKDAASNALEKGLSKTLENVDTSALIESGMSALKDGIIDKKTISKNITQTGGNSNNLEDFIKKMTELSDKSDTSPENINMAITKLQLMYFLQNDNYLELISAYSALSDSYYKLISLEKINKLPITKKPALLSLIDKLFINNLVTEDSSYDDYDQKMDENSMADFFGSYIDDSNQTTKNTKKVQKVAPKKPQFKLYGIGDKTTEEEDSIVFSTTTGNKM